MKISWLTTGLFPIPYSVVIINSSAQRKGKAVNKNMSKNRISACIVNDDNDFSNILSGIWSNSWGDFDHNTRCEIIIKKNVDVSINFSTGSRNGYPVVCASRNTRNTTNLTTFNQQLNAGIDMIQNEHQYKVSQGRIREIEQSLDQLYKEKISLHPRQFKMRENGLQGILAEIQEEIKKYNVLKEKPTAIAIESFAEIPVALIKARIASGMTQKDLADKLGMKEQQIQRYEANQYSSAGFHRLAEVAEALEVTLNNSLLTLRS
jgi:HTH-type transcriptional regulator / antitoxin HipB